MMKILTASKPTNFLRWNSAAPDQLRLCASTPWISRRDGLPL